MSKIDVSSVHVPSAANDHAAAPSLAHSPHRSAKKAQRNLLIFKLVEIERFTHEEVARRFKINRTRVTQIVQQVRMELAKAHPDDPQIQDHYARQRLERKLQKLRNQFALDAIAQAIKRDPTILVTNRAGSRGRGDQQEGWSETIQRDRPKSAALINSYLRVTRELGQLNERDMAENAMRPEKMTQYKILETVANALAHWRDEAPTTNDPPSAPFLAAVNDFISILYTWINRWRYGNPSALSWPVPLPDQPQDATASSTTTPGEINIAQPEANIGLTSLSNFSVAPTAIPHTT